VTPLGSLAVTTGWLLDRSVGEPPLAVHPVARFGTAMTWLEHRIHRDARSPGVAYTAIGVAAGTVVGNLARKIGGPAVSTATASWLAMAGSMLESESERVAVALADGDLATARDRVAMLVGRRTDELDESGVARATIESLAENTTDAVTATMFWASAGGATGAAVHRCINTMDAMVGHRNERFARFGWSAARLDDLANWLPARLTVLAVAVARPGRAIEVRRTVRRDAAQHPSPNGGVVEAAFAAALDVRLGGANDYAGMVDDRGVLGDGPPPMGPDIERAARLSRDVALVLLAITTAAQFIAGRALRRRIQRHPR